jgi:adenosylcobinamide-GDP ribazoletransferase
MKSFIAAVRFITILPLGRPGTYDPRGMIPHFPLVGLMLGGIVAVFDGLISGLWSPPVVSLLDVILLVYLTGGLHLDGLGDTADGLYGNRPRDRALEIMKDSRIGAMALLAVICALAVKWAGIMELGAHRHLLLLIVPGYARGGMVVAIRFLEYVRPRDGLGKDLFEKPLGLADFAGFILPVGLSFFMGWSALILNAAFVLVIFALIGFYKKRIGGITGDMLGAATEILEAVLFLAVSAGGVL